MIRTPTPGLHLDASDETQLLYAAAHERLTFTFNSSVFLQLAKVMPDHRGIILARQRNFTVSELITSLDRMLNTTQVDEWYGKVRWLSDWR